MERHRDPLHNSRGIEIVGDMEIKNLNFGQKESLESKQLHRDTVRDGTEGGRDILSKKKTPQKWGSYVHILGGSTSPGRSFLVLLLLFLLVLLVLLALLAATAARATAGPSSSRGLSTQSS